MQAAYSATLRAVTSLAAATLVANAVPSTLGAQASYANIEPAQVTTLSPAPARSADERAYHELHPVWLGRVTAPAKGSVRVTLERIGVPESALEPSWPVMVRWDYDARDPSKSFTAELFGSGNANGRMTLRGVITQGHGAGREVAVEVRGGSNNGAVMSFVSANESQ